MASENVGARIAATGVRFGTLLSFGMRSGVLNADSGGKAAGFPESVSASASRFGNRRVEPNENRARREDPRLYEPLRTGWNQADEHVRIPAGHPLPLYSTRESRGFAG